MTAPTLGDLIRKHMAKQKSKHIRHRLNQYRLSYKMWRHLLGNANKSKAPKHVKSQIMSHLNRSRNRLLKEMNRVAWELWPDNNGRPVGCPTQ